MSALAVSFQEEHEFFEEDGRAFSFFLFGEILINESDDVLGFFSIVVKGNRVNVIHSIFLID